MEPLDTREWLETQRLKGVPWADELLDLVDGAEGAAEMADAIDDLYKRAPERLKALDLWWLVVWITDQLNTLDEIEATIKEFGEDFHCPNGSPISDNADLLRAMLESDRWQKYDL